MALESRFFKGKQYKLFPFNKLDAIVTEAYRESSRKKEIDAFIVTVMTRREEMGTSTFVPINATEFYFLKDVNDLPF